MSTIQNLINEIKRNLPRDAAHDLDRLVNSPTAQAILNHDENDRITHRAELIASLAALPAKFARLKAEAGKPQDAPLRCCTASP